MLDICIVSYSTAVRDLDRLKKEIEMHTTVPYEIHTLINYGNKLSISAARNTLALDGARNYIAFLEPDVHLESGWASSLMTELETANNVGCVVARMLAPDAVRMYPDEEFKDRLTFHAVMMCRTTWKALCGFDERFRFLGSDADFRKRLGVIEGRDTIVSATVSMVHEHGSVVLKGALAAGLDLSRERIHCREIRNAINDGSMKFWHELDSVARADVRANPKYQIQ